MSLLERAAQWLDGLKILSEWLGSEGKTVPQVLAQKRANTCLRCPYNVKEFPIVEVVAVAVRKQIELKNFLKLRVDGEKSLHICKSCGCALRLKIWFPIEKITPPAEDRSNFHPNCWLLSESNHDNRHPV